MEHSPELLSHLSRFPPGDLLIPKSGNNFIALSGVLLTPNLGGVDLLLGKVKRNVVVLDLFGDTLAQSLKSLLVVVGEGVLHLGLTLGGDVGGLTEVEFVEEAGVEVRHGCDEGGKEEGSVAQTSKTTKKTKPHKCVWDVLRTFILDVLWMIWCDPTPKKRKKKNFSRN